MKVAIVSDTHGKIDKVYNSLIKKDVDRLIHLGDYYEDGEGLASLLGINSYLVKGNNDYHIKEAERSIIILGNKKVLLTHGHKYNLSYGLEDLIKIASDLEIDVCVFGHTHSYLNLELDGLLLLNPGSPTLPRGDGIPSYIIYNSDDNNIERVEI